MTDLKTGRVRVQGSKVVKLVITTIVIADIELAQQVLDSMNSNSPDNPQIINLIGKGMQTIEEKRTAHHYTLTAIQVEE